MGFALVLLLFAMTAIGVTLTGIGGFIAVISKFVFVFALGLAVVALLLARRAASPFGETWNGSDIPRWDSVRSGTRYRMEDEASGSLVSLRERRRI